MLFPAVFTKDIFGWQETVDSNENIAFFETGSALRFALFGKEALAQDAQVLVQGSGFPCFTLAHNVGSEAEVDALFSELASKKCEYRQSPAESIFGADTAAISPTPMAFLWEIAFNPFLQKLR